MNINKKIVRRIKKNSVIKASELVPQMTTRAQLGRLVEMGEIIYLGSGFYADPALDPFDASIIAVARFYPQAVISNITALVFHDLSDERIDEIDVDIPRNSSIRNKLITAHRVSEKNIIGVMSLDFKGHTIRIYSPERSLCEAYKLDPHGAIFFKAVKRYVAKEHDTETVSKLDKALGTKVLHSLNQEMADD